MSKAKTRTWYQQFTNDPYVKQAKKDGLRSRAAYKLKELQEKFKLIRPGMRVLDLGAAPGGWSVFLADWVKPKGQVYALDLLPMDPISGVTIIQGDIQEPAVLAELLSMMPKPTVDVIVSDMAPNLMGNASVDAARSLALWNMALEVAEDLLEPQGSLCIKVFHGPGFDAFVKKVRGMYTKVQVYKPKASKSESSEVYLVAQRKVCTENSDSEV